VEKLRFLKSGVFLLQRFFPENKGKISKFNIFSNFENKWLTYKSKWNKKDIDG